MQISTIPVGLGQKSAQGELSNAVRPNNVITTIPVEAYVATLDDDIPKASSVEELMNLFAVGGEFKLEGNMELTETPILTEDVETTIILNGKKVIAPEATEGKTDSTCFQVDAGRLVLQGEGEVIAQDAKYSNAVYARGGQVDILGGSYSNAGDNCDLIYAAGSAQINIYDGVFKATKNNGANGTNNEYPALNVKDGDRATAKITVYGGKFYKFNPADNFSEGSNTNFVAEGYESVQEGDWWVVRPIEG